VKRTLYTFLLELRNQRALDVVAGKCKTFEDYRHEIGVIAGLDMSLEELRKSRSEGEEIAPLKGED
jgi:hypothetical protein